MNSQLAACLTLSACVLGGCGKVKVAPGNPSSPSGDTNIQAMWSNSVLGAEIESQAGIVVELFGLPNEERVKVLRPENRSAAPNVLMNLVQFEHFLSGMPQTNFVAVIEIQAAGADFQPVTNVVRVLNRAGFSTVQVIAVGWGHKFVIPRKGVDQ